MNITKTKNEEKDYMLEDLIELEVNAPKKSRYATAIDESDDASDLENDFSDFEISDCDFNSIYDDTH